MRQRGVKSNDAAHRTRGHLVLSAAVVCAVLTGKPGPGVPSAWALPPARGEIELVPGQVDHIEFGSVVVLSPMLTLSTFLTQETVLFGSLGVTVAMAGEAPEERSSIHAVIGNPSVGLAQRLGEGLAVKVTLTLPLATRSAWGDGLGAVAESAARGLRGHVDPWLWLADHFATVGTLQWSLPVGRFLFEIHASAALMLPTQRLSIDEAREVSEGAEAVVDRGRGFALQFRGRAGARLWEGLWMIATANFVWTPTVTPDADQWSIAPEFRWTFADGGHAGVMAVFNVDIPWGPSFSSNGYFGLRLGGGWRF